MMSGFRIYKYAFLPLGVICLMGILLSPTIARELAGDCKLQGKVTVRNQPAPVGTLIEAYIDGNLMADTTVQSRGRYAIAIPADDPVTIDHDGWLQQDIITLVVNGESAQPTISAGEGRRSDIDITVQYVSDVRKSTWGKIKALFR
ncbi:MAG: hypothetical protein GF341_01110 [candidate division Zixibacteria bacterium]|nr:hypothetical protein [candidate division Zixibacteria bacterium]